MNLAYRQGFAGYHLKTMKVFKGCLSKLYANSFFGFLKNLVIIGCAAFTVLSVISTSTFIPTAYGFAADRIEWLDATISPLAVACGGIGVVIACCLLVGHELRANHKPRWIAAPAFLAVIAAVMAILSVVSLQEEHPSRTKREVVVIGIDNAKAVEKAHKLANSTPGSSEAAGDRPIGGAQPIAATEENATPAFLSKEEGCTCSSGNTVVRPSGIEEEGSREVRVVAPESSETENSSSAQAEATAEAEAEAEAEVTGEGEATAEAESTAEAEAESE